MIRTLKSAGADLHALAAHVEKSDGNGGAKLSKDEMQKIYDAGYNAGVEAVESKQKFDGDGFRDALKLPSANDMAIYCQKHSARLSEREREFIDSVAARSVWRKLSEKQEKWLRSIFHKLGGGSA